MLTPKDTKELRVVEDLMLAQRVLVREITETISRYFEVCKTKGYEPSWVAKELQEIIARRETKIDLKLAEWEHLRKDTTDGNQMRLR